MFNFLYILFFVLCFTCYYLSFFFHYIFCFICIIYVFWLRFLIKYTYEIPLKKLWMNSEGTHVEEIKRNQDKRNWFCGCVWEVCVCVCMYVRVINIDKKRFIEVLLERRWCGLVCFWRARIFFGDIDPIAEFGSLTALLSLQKLSYCS